MAKNRFKVKDVLVISTTFYYNLISTTRLYFGKLTEQERPLVIHRALLGLGDLCLTYRAGAFPAWLAPEQIRIIAVADKFENYAKSKRGACFQWYRVTVDYSSDSFSKKLKMRNRKFHTYLVWEKENQKASWRYLIRLKNKELEP